MQAPLFPPDAAAPRAVPLTRRQIRRAEQLYDILYRCGDDVDFWASEIGYPIVDRVRLPKPFTGVLYCGEIVLTKGLSWQREVISVSHEIFHHEFHAASVAYREEPATVIDLHENQADCFGLIVLEKSLHIYESLDQFRSETRVPDYLKPVRERLYYLVKQ